ncbi:tripartite tricarboxylate transporter substrate binding protein [Pseudovibrio sp. Tun.PSC04-5.I4]|uniref:Bug family tripartite tricarboxylate transporter substrate binding protein n=1 Tax=Pseudovibrio sp. Tun.PSC04-5.I4 TaxID=1798213 RepID=UPI00087F8968|nr:tripartite tricarboxylate transporter substrate binding protein [Pseudovibrio sp. Tun.PSC04-5.I4]SDQ74783.1 Tripartite-type tricarboxylate transporter, receptor component TctC [Pseudovibrio sp. Tun.PSC04-5.I4]
MKLSMKLLAVAALGAAAFSSPANAEFPERNIESIYPWGPGATMAVSQMIADAMGEQLGTNISVVSTPGAAGTKAFKTAMQKPADGYTIFDGYVAPLVLQPLLGNADWTYADFTPLWSATSNAFAIVVRKDEDRFNTFPEFVAYMKKNPGKLRYTTGPTKTLPHMVLAKVMQMSNVVGKPIPYREMQDGVKDLRGGVLDFLTANPGFYRTNKDHLKVLAVLSELDDASSVYDGAPRVTDYGIDMGISGLSPMGWNWWLVRKDTPAPIVKKLRDAMGAALATPELREKSLNVGFVPLGYSPEQYSEIVGPVAAQLQSGIDAIAWEEEQLKALR